MKTDRVIAKYLALTNASEFIRGHGEEGGQNEEDYPCNLQTYYDEAAKIADRLDIEAANHMKKYITQLKEVQFI